MADYDIQDEAERRLVCPRCEAQPGHRCRTLSGKLARTHASRSNPLFDAYSAGIAAAREVYGVSSAEPWG